MAKKRPYRYLLYLLLLLFKWLSNICPRRWMLGFAEFCGFAAWQILPRERQRIKTHLRQAFGSEKSDSDLDSMGRRVFQNLGKTAVDALRIPGILYDSKIIKCDDDTFRKIEKALQKKKGLICLTAHLGNWELITGFVIKAGFPGTVIGKRIYYEPFNRVLEELRITSGAHVIYRDESAKPIFQVLKNNEIIGVLPDQDVDSIDGIFIKFFGEWAYTPTAPAKISLTSGAPILPLFMVRIGEGYRLLSDELIEPETYERFDKEEAVRQLTVSWSKITERMIREYPDQWVWMHRRWKTRPDPEILAKLEAVEKIGR